MKLIIAEKPSVAKSIASALGASSRADGFYEGSGLLVSWCVGHLVSPMDAGGYDERFKKWRYDDLPILPEPFRYVLAPGKEGAFENLRTLMNRPDVDTIVNACDAGREGELIFRLVYEMAGFGYSAFGLPCAASVLYKGLGLSQQAILNFRARDLKISKFASGYSLAVLAIETLPSISPSTNTTI